MEISKQNYLAHLNKNQKEAIIDLEGPCLIVAGAGSGQNKSFNIKSCTHNQRKKSLAKSNSLRHLY